MEEGNKLILILAIIGILMIISGFVTGITEAINENRCYELPLAEFYRDNKCERYWKVR